jgi:transposase
LDLGKFNSVVCLFDPADSTHRFQSLATTPQAVHDLLAGPIQTPGEAASVLVVFETCEVCGWVHDIATALGFAVAVANPCHEAWRWTKVKRKTDQDDALKLAKMALMNQLPTVHMPSPQMRQRRRLVHHRQSLVRRRTQSKNQVRSIFAQQGLALPPRNYAGLVPKQMESGQMKRSGRIARRGPALLLGMLVEVAWMLYRHNDWAKQFVTRVARGIKGRKKIAIVALARKLLVILWAMLRDNRPWRQPPLPA